MYSFLSSTFLTSSLLKKALYTERILKLDSNSLKHFRDVHRRDRSIVMTVSECFYDPLDEKKLEE